MHYFHYKNGQLHAEDIAVADLVREHGTPLYIYSASTLKRHYRAFDSAFAGIDHLTCFSVKANSNLSLLKILAQEVPIPRDRGALNGQRVASRAPDIHIHAPVPVNNRYP